VISHRASRHMYACFSAVKWDPPVSSDSEGRLKHLFKHLVGLFVQGHYTYVE